MKLTKAQVEVLRMCNERPRATTKQTHHDWVSGRTASSLANRGAPLLRYAQGLYEITDIGREALRETERAAREYEDSIRIRGAKAELEAIDRTAAEEKVEPLSWYPLDGSFHESVARQMSAVHLSHNGKQALCDPTGRRFLLLTDMPHDEEDVDAEGRKRCAKCVKARTAAAKAKLEAIGESTIKLHAIQLVTGTRDNEALAKTSPGFARALQDDEWRNDAAKRANKLHKDGRKPTVAQFGLDCGSTTRGEPAPLEEILERVRLDALAYPHMTYSYSIWRAHS